jgi:hypothetical protein
MKTICFSKTLLFTYAALQSRRQTPTTLVPIEQMVNSDQEINCKANEAMPFITTLTQTFNILKTEKPSSSETMAGHYTQNTTRPSNPDHSLNSDLRNSLPLQVWGVTHHILLHNTSWPNRASLYSNQNTRLSPQETRNSARMYALAMAVLLIFPESDAHVPLIVSSPGLGRNTTRRETHSFWSTNIATGYQSSGSFLAQCEWILTEQQGRACRTNQGRWQMTVQQKLATRWYLILDTVVAQSVHCLTTDWTTRVRALEEAKNLSSSLCVQTSSEAHPVYPMGTGGPFPG